MNAQETTQYAIVRSVMRECEAELTQEFCDPEYSKMYRRASHEAYILEAGKCNITKKGAR